MAVTAVSRVVDEIERSGRAAWGAFEEGALARACEEGLIGVQSLRSLSEQPGEVVTDMLEALLRPEEGMCTLERLTLPALSDFRARAACARRDGFWSSGSAGAGARAVVAELSAVLPMAWEKSGGNSRLRGFVTRSRLPGACVGSFRLVNWACGASDGVEVACALVLLGSARVCGPGTYARVFRALGLGCRTSGDLERWKGFDLEAGCRELCGEGERMSEGVFLGGGSDDVGVKDASKLVRFAISRMKREGLLRDELEQIAKTARAVTSVASFAPSTGISSAARSLAALAVKPLRHMITPKAVLEHAHLESDVAKLGAVRLALPLLAESRDWSVSHLLAAAAGGIRVTAQSELFSVETLGAEEEEEESFVGDNPHEISFAGGASNPHKTSFASNPQKISSGGSSSSNPQKISFGGSSSSNPQKISSGAVFPHRLRGPRVLPLPHAALAAAAAAQCAGGEVNRLVAGAIGGGHSTRFLSRASLRKLVARSPPSLSVALSKALFSVCLSLPPGLAQNRAVRALVTVFTASPTPRSRLEPFLQDIISPILSTPLPPTTGHVSFLSALLRTILPLNTPHRAILLQLLQRPTLAALHPLLPQSPSTSSTSKLTDPAQVARVLHDLLHAATLLASHTSSSAPLPPASHIEAIHPTPSLPRTLRNIPIANTPLPKDSIAKILPKKSTLQRAMAIRAIEIALRDTRTNSSASAAIGTDAGREIAAILRGNSPP